MRRHIISAAMFLLILALLLVPLSLIFRPKNNSQEAGMEEPRANGILAEPENSIDVLFLGNSLAYCSMNPMEIWKEYGIPTYVCSTVGQRVNITMQFLRRVLRTQKPKVVALEAMGPRMPTGIVTRSTELLEEKVPFFRYHNRWKTLRWQDFYTEPHHTALREDKGFYGHIGEKPADLTDYMAPSDVSAGIPRKSRRVLAEIAELCRDNGIQLVLFSAPSPVNWNSAWHNAFAAMAETLGVPYLDMNLMPEEVPMDWNHDSFDGGDHLNVAGAKKASDYMGKWLIETGLFTDKRQDPAYTQWNIFLTRCENGEGMEYKTAD